MKIRTIIGAALLSPCLVFSAGAGDAVDELRFGGTWAQPEWLDNGHAEADQFGINAEILFRPVNISISGRHSGESGGFWHSVFNPRPHIGGLANFSSNGSSYGYAGLTWHHDLSEAFFLETGFGMGVTNGSEKASANRAGLGSKVLFHEKLAFGVNLSETMTAVLQFEHLSHASLFGDNNRGLSNTSLRLGHKF